MQTVNLVVTYLMVLESSMMGTYREADVELSTNPTKSHKAVVLLILPLESRIVGNGVSVSFCLCSGSIWDGSNT